MSDPFLGEIRIFPFSYAPVGWAFCTGQLLPIQQYSALFSLIGTTYGGNGVQNFALPDLQGRVPVDWGEGQGLTGRYLGDTGGSEEITLTANQVPSHEHALMASAHNGTLNFPGPQNSLARSVPLSIYTMATDAPPLQALAANAIGPAGGDLPHANLMPYLTLNICICLNGTFPQRQ